jgi:hypothetical protein
MDDDLAHGRAASSPSSPVGKERSSGTVGTARLRLTRIMLALLDGTAPADFNRAA